MAIESPLQRFIVEYLKKIGASQRKFGAAMDLSETTFGTYSRMSSAMGLDTLDKILTTYPSTKQALIEYLGGNTEKNLTSDFKMDKSKNGQNLSTEELLELYRNAYNNVTADLKERNKKISEQDARIKDLEAQLEKKVSKT